MANTYTVERGDTLWGIATRFASSISGNTTQAKINTLVALNGISNPNLIYVNQVIKLSGSASSSGSSSTPVSAQKVTFTGFGLQSSENDSGRTVVAVWTWGRENTKSFKYRWVQYIPEHDGIPGTWTLIGSESEVSAWEGTVCRLSATADNAADRVQIKVIPVASSYKDKNNNDIPHWKEGTGPDDVQWAESSVYYFSENPPKKLSSAPKVEVDDLTLNISYDQIDPEALDATGVKFNIVKIVDNVASSLGDTAIIPIDPISHQVNYSHTNNIVPGAEYRVRAQAVNSKGKTSGWTEFSENVATKPSAPAKITVCKAKEREDDSISVYLEWTPVQTAEKYIIEYVIVESDFDTAPDNIQSVDTEEDRTSYEIVDIDIGQEYFFRVRAVRGTFESDPSPIVSIPVGKTPAAPTTWSSANSAFVGDAMELNWTHNSQDNSRQTFAQLKLTIDDVTTKTFTFENTTKETDDAVDGFSETNKFTYGQAVSYKGELYVKMNTEHPDLKNAKVVWSVRTAGITNSFSNSEDDWSTPRTIYIYEKPTLALSVSTNSSGSDIIETLESFPFYIRGKVELESYKYQKPIGYHLQVVSNHFYETVDDVGRTKTVNIGDPVYSRYFDTADILEVLMTASDIDLESGMRYTVHCIADMSTGLSVPSAYEFTVSWTDVEYAIKADISVDTNAYTALVTPYCEDANGNLVENVELSIYRRAYDGSYVEIASHIPNRKVSVTDPHPALDYARYRFVATDIRTGALSFYDMAGHPIKCTSIIVQWDEAWSTFDVTGEHDVGGPPWTGSLLRLPYNVDVADTRKRDVEFADYAGREHSVSYYGTKITENPTWNVVIPKDDVETVYALRRLSMWNGDAYVREPSGTGFWANVGVAFNLKHNDVTIPATLTITRVEGGM